MASSNSDEMIHLNIWSQDKMLDPVEDCVPQGYKVSQDCKTEALSLFSSSPMILHVLSKTANPLFCFL